MEKLPGAPLRWDKATSEQRSKVMGQLADIFLELEKRPLPISGSLCLRHDIPIVSGFAQPPLFSSPEQTLGPFETVESSLRAIILQQQDQIVYGELSSLAVDSYLSHCWRHDMITHVTTHCHIRAFLNLGLSKADQASSSSTLTIKETIYSSMLTLT